MKIIGILLVFSAIAHSSAQLLRRRETGETNPHLFEERIIGGFQAPIARYQYTVSLQRDDDHFCGGSLIAPDVVLSAAHCAGQAIQIAVGRHDLDLRNGDVVQVKREVPHPWYNPSGTDNDFNLIFLTRPTTADVPIVKLNKLNSLPSSRDPVQVMGWGDTDPAEWGQRFPDVLHSVELNVISNEECSQAKGFVGWFNYQSYEGSITSNMLCAYDVRQDSCQGDSGGPLVIKGESSNGAEDVQVGIVSWGMGCADSRFPGVYSRVSSAYDWIRSEVCGNSINPPSSFECGNVFDKVSSPSDTKPDIVTPPKPATPLSHAPSSEPTYYVPENPSSDFSNSWSDIWCWFFSC